MRATPPNDASHAHDKRQGLPLDNRHVSDDRGTLPTHGALSPAQDRRALRVAGHARPKQLASACLRLTFAPFRAQDLLDEQFSERQRLRSLGRDAHFGAEDLAQRASLPPSKKTRPTRTVAPYVRRQLQGPRVKPHAVHSRLRSHHPSCLETRYSGHAPPQPPPLSKAEAMRFGAPYEEGLAWLGLKWPHARRALSMYRSRGRFSRRAKWKRRYQRYAR